MNKKKNYFDCRDKLVCGTCGYSERGDYYPIGGPPVIRCPRCGEKSICIIDHDRAVWFQEDEFPLTNSDEAAEPAKEAREQQTILFPTLVRDS